MLVGDLIYNDDFDANLDYAIYDCTEDGKQYCRDMIYDDGIIYILSWIDYLKYRIMLLIFVKKIEKKQKEDPIENARQKTEKLIRKNEVM